MERRNYLKTLGIASIGSVGLASGTVFANGKSNTNNSANNSTSSTEEEQPIDLNSGPYHTTDQLTAHLALLDRRSDRISLRRIARSAGREDPIWEVKIGKGDTNIHLVTQIHGDEPSGTEASLYVLRHLADGDTKRVHNILENITLTIIPRINPDGAMYSIDTNNDNHTERLSRRFNTQEWDSPDSYHEPYYHYHPSEGPPGYDMNRDFNIRTNLIPQIDTKENWWEKEKEDGNVDWSLDMPYKGHTLFSSGLELTPEVNAVSRSFLEADPDFAITTHHQGIPIDPESSTKNEKEPSIMSVMPAFGPAYKKRALYYDPNEPISSYLNPFLSKEASTRSLRLNTLVEQTLDEQSGPWDVFDTVTRYGYTTLWGSYLDALCPQTDAAGMLYEVSGASSRVGSRAYGLKVEAVRVGLLESFAAIANDSSLSTVNESDYFDIPVKGDQIEENAR